MFSKLRLGKCFVGSHDLDPIASSITVIWIPYFNAATIQILKNTRPTNTSILATFSSRDHMSMRLFVLSTFCPRRMPVTICPATFSPSAVDKVNVETVVYFLFRSSFSCQPREVGSKVREKSRELSKFIVSLAFTQLIYDAVRN